MKKTAPAPRIDLPANPAENSGLFFALLRFFCTKAGIEIACSLVIVKNSLNWIIASLVCWFLVVEVNATTITNALWTFPANTVPGPSSPIAANLSTYSTGDNLAWVAADGRLGVNFVAHTGQGTALEFSYNGNHAAYLNGSVLTLGSTVSGLPAGSTLNNFQLTYNTLWSAIFSSVTETWAYSINGGAFTNFSAYSVSGNTWQNESSVIPGATLANGDVLVLRATITGATGNTRNLDFDNFQITSTPVPEPSSGFLASLGGLVTLIVMNRRRT